MNDRSPQWIKAEGGHYVNVERADAIKVTEFGEEGFCITIHFGNLMYYLTDPVDEDTAAKAVDALEKLLPISIIDMDLDILWPISKGEQP